MAITEVSLTEVSLILCHGEGNASDLQNHQFCGYVGKYKIKPCCLTYFHFPPHLCYLISDTTFCSVFLTCGTNSFSPFTTAAISSVYEHDLEEMQ
jgi:hypothetical protein